MSETYCDYVLAHPDDTLNRAYHDHHYGFPIDDDNALFERLVLEINQAGLSWTLILKKHAAFRRAYADFDIARVAAFDDDDKVRLLADSGIIRNRMKINAAIYNAQQILILQQQFGSFKAWLDRHHPMPLNEWVTLFKRTFKFVGHEIVHEFLMSSGYLSGAHQPHCPIYQTITALSPPWLGCDSGRKK
ncbi:DNA-3-methyladenine glycosylase I [Spirabiliibacterium falconis]|uniref:DNA-3-methyladenine glycosylase I n=1 Tax=Spirabiliibacterium falconis TaxID=572023 RepID=UPI001AACD7BF|nr:DNA-3-methyladenine glycosylase I [Spirabiliibacterium falconis]MBE2893594.1 DNA-3-methyladenine glycosylase I [Spirabiliibacterium falconis]